MPASKQKGDMNKVTDIVLKPLGQSIYMKPMTMHFTHNGVKRTWDLLAIHDSVAVFIYNITRNVVVLVKQFRPAVYFNSIPEEDRKGVIDINKYPAELGITLEMCAGIVDKDAPLIDIASDEVLEECGYSVPSAALQKIGSYRSGVGTQGAHQTSYYCEVTDDMRSTDGGGVGDEIIEVVEMSVDELKKYVMQDEILSPPSFMFGVYWFLYNKAR